MFILVFHSYGLKIKFLVYLFFSLLVFINQNTNFQNVLSKKDVVYYKNKKDLIQKLKYYNTNNKERIKIAKSGHEKYHKHMSNIVVSNYILSCVGLNKTKKPFWHSIT